MENHHPFTLEQHRPTSVRYGKVFITTISLDVPREKKRIIRVYLPEDYHPEQRYAVLYMSDGQNLVDKYTSAYGDWKLDQKMHQLIKEDYPSFIIVGIDCPKNPLSRILEYSFSTVPFIPKKQNGISFSPHTHTYGDELLSCLVNKIKPLIDQCFSTNEIAGIGGSSMGGVFALNGFISYPQTFSFCLSFSPAYNLYIQDIFKQYLESKNMRLYNNDNTLVLYTGTVGFEKQFFQPTIKMYQYFEHQHFDEHHLALFIDSRGIHHEATWSIYFMEAMHFYLKKKAKEGKV